MTFENKLASKILSVLFAASSGEIGAEWLTSSELLNQVRPSKPGISFPEILKLANELSSKGLIEFWPVQRDKQIVGFTTRISRQGRNSLVHGQPFLTRS
jgi:hypothetical protein